MLFSTTPSRSRSKRHTASRLLRSPSARSTAAVASPSCPATGRITSSRRTRSTTAPILWALRSLGVRQILAPCAVGGLRAELGPGSFVVPDQLFDRTRGRIQTFYDTGACHIAFADPYCGRLREALLKGLADEQPQDGGTMVVIDGPRFSTRAESRWYGDQGWSVIGMTGHPEAVLARELALCYATIALVTDLDAGVDDESAVNQADVFEVFARYTERLRDALRSVAASVESDIDCSCTHALDGMTLPVALP